MTEWISSPTTGTRRKSMSPWIKDSVDYYPHQVTGVRELARRKSFLLADDMGLGKSLQAITVFAIDVVRGWASTMLVVCPVTLKGNWADEIEKFTGIPYMVLHGTPKQRQQQLVEFGEMKGPKILVVNYEQVVAHKDELDAFNFDVAAFDEAHYLKNPNSKRTKACMDVYSRRSFMLTGTPLLNHVNELWTILHRIGAYKYGYYKFINRYAVMGGYKDKQIVGAKNEDELSELLNQYMLRRLKKDVLDLPEVQIIERRVDLHAEQIKLYNEVVNDMKLTTVDGVADIENALTRFLRLKQICGTTFAFTGKDISSKLDLAVNDDLELLENGHRIIVFTQFRDMLSCYRQRIIEATGGAVPVFELHGDVPKEERQSVVKEWSNTATPGVIVCMLQVAGVGLNMTAARHVSFIDELFVPGLNQQAIDRAHRIGASTTQPVQVRKYIARGTIENRIQQILRTKKKVFGDIVETDPDWKRKLVELLTEEDEVA